MHPQLTTYITLVCTSGVLNLYLCLYAFGKRHHYKNIADFFILYTAFITIYCFGSAFGLMSTTIEQIKFWTVVQYIGLALSPPLGMLFIMQYLGYSITKTKRTLILMVPVFTFIAVATNEWHHLFYRVYEIDRALGAPYIYQEIGTLYMIHGVFIFSCMFLAFLLVLFRFRETAKEYRPQLLALLCGQLIPIVTAFIYLVGLTPDGIDPVPMVLCLSSLLYLWSIHSSRLFTILPIAKEAIFHSINDGVIVLDESHRLIEYNEACKMMFPHLNQSLFGKHVDDVWKQVTGNTFPFQLDQIETTYEINITSKQIYQVRTSLIKHRYSRPGLLILFTDVSQVKELQAKLEHQAYYDELTQIFNRRAFFQLCEPAYADTKRDKQPYSILLMDIDYFKSVNDTYGHGVGDRLLNHVAKTCEAQLKEGMLFARYGGEEFVLALLGYTTEQAKAYANSLCRQVEQQPLILREGVLSVTLSVGLAETTGAPDETLNQLLNKADQALYKAKENGRNQVQLYKEVKALQLD
ncbi:diguanylate cyclase [Bacillus sp. BGMRC 2118]|nr:diguanylate cyclase [Bacillus sp. BGMRC 2118]